MCMLIFYRTPNVIEPTVKLLIYLNKDWNSDWNGALEFWDKSMTKPIQKFNRCSIGVSYSTPVKVHTTGTQTPVLSGKLQKAFVGFVLFFVMKGRSL